MCRLDWNAVSAIATLSAALIALGVPFLLERAQAAGRKKASEDALRGSIAEIVRAVREALTAYSSVYAELSKDKLVGDYSMRFQDFAERGERAAEVVGLLITRPGLTDGAIRCGVEGAQLGRQVHAAALDAAEDRKINRETARGTLLRASIRAKRLTRQIARLIEYYRIDNEPADVWPEIEKAYRTALDTGAFPDDVP